MKEIVKRWLQFANADLDMAKRAFRSHNPNSWTFLLILWHCHQVAEKLLKAIIISKGKNLVTIHDLPELFKKAGCEYIEEEKEFIFQLNKYYLKSRYPDITYSPLPKVNKSLTKDLLSKTEKLYKIVKNKI